ncbi:hypothetical protein P3X46_015232 [Hevea brasiliensis]|uniref:PORR domain-containing protein n=1 Tax=Hevea brasiliensis TaxID=3981 RepID=A0ABQ9LZB8_HEVBR|nr:hypothetical protein P3X46_015232 [Hevea brasiliensis]
MLFKTNSNYTHLHNSLLNPGIKIQIKSISSLKVVWRKDHKLDFAIEKDKSYKFCARVVKEVLNKYGQRLRHNVRVKTFIDQNPGLFRIKPKSEPVLFSALVIRFFLRKEMTEWVRDWLELDYLSPYVDVSHLDQASPEMEKRAVGVFHELLSLLLFKRIPVPIVGKFSEEYRLSNAFSSGIKTAMLREAYKDSELINTDPLREIKNRFIELLEAGWQERAEQLKSKREAVVTNMGIGAMMKRDLDGQESCGP